MSRKNNKTNLTPTELESLVRAQTKRKRTEAAILAVVGVAGVLTVGALAPGVMTILRPFAPSLQEANHKQTVGRAITRLIHKGYLQKSTTTHRYRLTPTGEARLQQLTTRHVTLGGSSPSLAKRWDGKWRVIIFDIAEKNRNKREELRRLLVAVGFTKLQDSVWVHPHECGEVITLVKMQLALGYRVIYIIADAVENDAWLRKLYQLPPN